MLLFTCDYLEGAHEKILQRLTETNMEKLPGYENDPYCISAAEKIRTACGCPEGSVFFTVGGTQTNAVVISTMLQSCEGVLAADTGHVNVHEAGAIEYTGHKVLTLPAYEGKMKAADLKAYLVDFYKDPSHEHMVIPGMVYLSYPTEYGTPKPQTATFTTTGGAAILLTSEKTNIKVFFGRSKACRFSLRETG